MADNETTGTGKAVATDKVTYSGDADQNVQLVRVVEVTGSEGSKTVVDLNYGSGATNTGTQRVTLASDDPAVTSLSTLTAVDYMLGTDFSSVFGTASLVIATQADDTANTQDTIATSALGYVFDGTTWDRMRGDSTDGLLVNLGANNDVTVTNAGTFAVQVDGSALTALQLIDDTVFADDAGFTIGTSKIQAVGGYAVAHGSNPDAADAADAGVFLMNRHRMPFVIGGHPNTISASARITGANTDTALLPGTIASGTKIVITRLTVTISNATTVNVGVRIGFGTSVVPADNTTGVADVLVDNDGFPPGGGCNIGDGSGIIGVGGDGAELRITNDAPTSGAIHVTYSYYTIES